ncbi:MAG: acyl-CoA dehydrogenase family protein [Baekduia sp.]
MRFGFSDDQQEIKDTARALLAERSPMAAVRAASEGTGIDPALWAELVELGWPAIAVPEDLGGQGLGLVELAVVCEELGYACAAVPAVQSAAALEVVCAAAAPDVAQVVVDAVGRGVPAAIGTEGVAVAGAEAADWIVLLDAVGGARLVDRAEAAVEPVETIDPGRPAGLVTAHAGSGLPLAEPVVSRGVQRAAIAVAAELVGVAQRALDMTVAYVKEREQFGRPVGSFQAVSHRCANMLLLVEGARSALYYAAWAADAEPERLAEVSALAKATASDAARQVTGDAIQAHGGIGFTWEADVHWLYKRAQTSAVWLGGAGAHRAALAAILRERAAGAV